MNIRKKSLRPASRGSRARPQKSHCCRGGKWDGNRKDKRQTRKRHAPMSCDGVHARRTMPQAPLALKGLRLAFRCPTSSCEPIVPVECLEQRARQTLRRIKLGRRRTIGGTLPRLTNNTEPARDIKAAGSLEMTSSLTAPAYPDEIVWRRPPTVSSCGVGLAKQSDIPLQ